MTQLAPQPLWMPSPERAAATQLTAFMHGLATTDNFDAVGDYFALHRWSLEQPEAFWRAVWRFTEVLGSSGETVCDDPQRLPGCEWFPDATLNYAENLLRFRDEREALVEIDESDSRRAVTYRELAEQVRKLTNWMAGAGIEPGDRVAGFMPNCIEAVVAMLATASLGAVWSSCSPDFGKQGALDRFGQIAPRLLFTADGYRYNGKACDSLARAGEIAGAIGTVERVIVVPKLSFDPDVGGICAAVMWEDCMVGDAQPLSFLPRRFNDPLFILYSSGTTGVPKCIVHGTGGTLLQHAKEHALQTDISRADRFFYFTTCGWMMWNWLVSGLARGATLILYDGSPFVRDGRRLIDAIEEESITVFGVGAKYLGALQKSGLVPADHHDLSSLKTILSTGSPLPHEGFQWVYRAFKADLHLASISGGTDIVSCFAGGVPTLPVYAGQIQAAGLGMATAIWTEAGEPVEGEKGELVCTQAFPSCPVGFWQDPDGSKFHRAYFDRWPGVWAHGDYGEVTAEGGFIIHGRSDAVLNPGGVRIGTAEIYRQVEQVSEVLDSVVVGQSWQDDVRVILFVVLREGLTLDDVLINRIRHTIRANTTPRHVPTRVIQVSDIPRTISGKIAELAVRKVIHGETVGNRDALANPEALALFSGLTELAP
ncbi:MAG: acetoacetate--CoA ligase [Halieaceae bacterium]|nr:acetoacetate--CoA ligase [Halieaceae bacterium]